MMNVATPSSVIVWMGARWAQATVELDMSAWQFQERATPLGIVDPRRRDVIERPGNNPSSSGVGAQSSDAWYA